jgi:hypothetical protein
VELEDGVGEAVIHNNMGLAYEMLNNLEQAQEHYEKVHPLKLGYLGSCTDSIKFNGILRVVCNL